MDLGLSQYALPLFIALFGLESNSLSITGAFTAVLSAYVILLRQSISWFLILFFFYVLGTLATRWRKKEKRKHSLVQKIRSPWNVIGNGGIAIIMALTGGLIGFIGFVSAVASATADTLSSEIGVLSSSPPRMVTNFKKVSPGTNGAVTSLGTFIGFLGALSIGVVSLLEMDIFIIPIAGIAGIIGCFADSYIGALLENRGYIGNSTTNFLATATGAISGMFLYLLIMV